MLQRPSPSRQAIYNRRHRARLKAGRATAVVEFGPEVVDLLVKAKWLPPQEVYSRNEIAPR